MNKQNFFYFIIMLCLFLISGYLVINLLEIKNTILLLIISFIIVIISHKITKWLINTVFSSK